MNKTGADIGAIAMLTLGIIFLSSSAFAKPRFKSTYPTKALVHV